MEREVFCTINHYGKNWDVVAFEKRYDVEGKPYYGRYDAINTKQKKRLMDWCAKQPWDIQRNVLQFVQEVEA